MSDRLDDSEYSKPFVEEGRHSITLHFSEDEVQSAMRRKDPDALELEYTRRMMGFLLFNEHPRNIAMIGLGGGSLAKFCYRHLAQTRIAVIEINPHVIALRDAFKVPPDDERFAVIRADGARFVRESPEGFDVLLVDGFNSHGIPDGLCSQRFYDDCRELLHEGGVLVVNLHHALAEYELYIERIRRSFGDLIEVGDEDRCNSIIFARRADLRAQWHAPLDLDRRAHAQIRPALTQISALLKAGSR